MTDYTIIHELRRAADYFPYCDEFDVQIWPYSSEVMSWWMPFSLSNPEERIGKAISIYRQATKQ